MVRGMKTGPVDVRFEFCLPFFRRLEVDWIGRWLQRAHVQVPEFHRRARVAQAEAVLGGVE